MNGVEADAPDEKKFEGEMRNGKPWTGKFYDKDRNFLFKYVFFTTIVLW